MLWGEVVISVLVKDHSGCCAEIALAQCGNGVPFGHYCRGPGRDNGGLGQTGTVRMERDGQVPKEYW